MNENALSLPKMPSWQVLDRLERSDLRAPKRIGPSSAVSTPAKGRTRARAAPNNVKFRHEAYRCPPSGKTQPSWR
jgi:hypothetical protein